MRHFTILLTILSLLFFNSCNSDADLAKKWTEDIKARIIEDANQQWDKKYFDSLHNELTLYKSGKKLKSFLIKAYRDSIGKIISRDTIVSIFFSADQNFELVRELCPDVDRSFEGIRYKGNHLGLAEFKYCNGNLKESGFRYNNLQIGVWTKYDSVGNVIEKKDYGKNELLNKLNDIKYYR